VVTIAGSASATVSRPPSTSRVTATRLSSAMIFEAKVAWP
jgi:hypothetical protein